MMVMLSGSYHLLSYYFVPVTMHKGLDKGLDLDFSHFILTVALWVTVLCVQMMLLGSV